MLTNIVPTTLVGIKRLAKTIKAERNIPLYEAHDVAARQAGFENLRHAQNVFGGKCEAPVKPTHRVFLTVYWKDRDTGSTGRETLSMTLTCHWADLVTAAQLKNHPTLHAFRPEGPDHLAREHVVTSQSGARRSICAAARGLQFMDATKLRPSKAHSRAFPGGTSMNTIPGRDHSSVWYDPESKGYVFVDEPYEGQAQDHAEKRTAWASKHGFDLVKAQWPGMYAPDIGSRIYLNSSLTKGVPLAKIVAALDSLPPPVVEAAWPGESAPFSPMFVSPGTIARAAEAKAERPAQREPAGPRNTVGYVQTLVGPQRRPNTRMPLEAHTRVGYLLKSVAAVTYWRPGTYNRVNAARSELEEWVQREYRTEAEMSQEVFVNLYYGETGQSAPRSMSETDRARHCDSLEAARKLLVEHYPDCAPLRGLLKKLAMAQKSLQTWTRM